MTFIREWVVTIISVIIFVTFVEILIPSSNYKRYINVVIGFLLMTVILTPLTKFIKGQINLGDGVFKTSSQLELLTAKNRINSIQYDNNEAVVKLYKSKISEQIKNYIEYSTEYIVDEILVEVEDDNNSPQFGSITNFNITLKEKMEDVKSGNKVVEPVQINISTGKNSNNTVEANSILINSREDSIKEEISNLYDVTEDNINIHVLKSN
ncbi:MAG: stage III sporulation protein AF [Candidatus Alkaliphilus sp. MAG34]|nr:stage III sporulation protein AF [Clostridiales bacterium]